MYVDFPSVPLDDAAFVPVEDEPAKKPEPCGANDEECN